MEDLFSTQYARQCPVCGNTIAPIDVLIGVVIENGEAQVFRMYHRECLFKSTHFTKFHIVASALEFHADWKSRQAYLEKLCVWRAWGWTEMLELFTYITVKGVGISGASFSGYVYIMECNGLYKIGKTKDLEKRVAQVQTSNPYPVELAMYWRSSNPTALEKQLHKRFADKRLRGEWFALSQEDLQSVDCLDSALVL